MSKLTSSLPSADFEKWCHRELWSLAEFAFLVLGKEPMQGAAAYQDDEFCLHYKNLERLTTDAMMVGSLKPVSVEEDEDLFTVRRYIPGQILSWAQKINYKIPAKLIEYAKPSGILTSSSVSKWGYGHDTKLLAIARELIEQYWEEKEPSSAPSKDAIMLELLEKHPKMSKSEAKLLDTITRHDSLRKTKL